MGRLERSEDGGPVVSSTVRCLSCGHCASVCPGGALSLGDQALEPLSSDWRLDASRVARLLKGRRSIRVFRDEGLPKETLAEMIEVAQYAPSGHNSQPLAWTVISRRSSVQQIARATIDWMRKSIAESLPLAAALDMPAIVKAWDAGTDGICRNAPHLIIAHAPAGLSSGPHSAAIAMTYLDLAAQSLGAGTCWAGFVSIAAGASSDVHAALELPEGRRCAGIVMAGRPAIKYVRIPARNPPCIEWR
jgi:nitroreductase